MISDEAVEAAANAISQSSGLRFDGFWTRVKDLEPEDREYALAEARAALTAAAPFIAAQASSREWGVTYADERGDLHTEWGYTRSPFDQIDKDGEFQTGKRTWGKAYEILSRPKNAQTSEWQADDCPWKATS